MDILLAALLGLGIGTSVAVINHLIMLKNIKKLSLTDTKKDNGTIFKIYLARYIINLGVLFLVFIFREYLPTRFDYTILCTALGLAIPSQILAIKSRTNERIMNAALEKYQESQNKLTKEDAGADLTDITPQEDK